MPYMTQTNNNNVVVVERVVQQQPTAQPQIIYVNAQPQKQEEKKEESELEQLVGCWFVSRALPHPKHPTDALLAVHLFGDLPRRFCAHAVVFSLEGWPSVLVLVFAFGFCTIHTHPATVILLSCLYRSLERFPDTNT